jgi:hypothetical protein
MKNFNETYLNIIRENKDSILDLQEDPILKHILELIKSFAERINEGFGWISEDDAMRQFYDFFPEFKNEIFDKSKLEEFVIKELKNHTEVRAE